MANYEYSKLDWQFICEQLVNNSSVPIYKEKGKTKFYMFAHLLLVLHVCTSRLECVQYIWQASLLFIMQLDILFKIYDI